MAVDGYLSFVMRIKILTEDSLPRRVQEVECNSLRALVNNLGEREQRIMRLRFGLDGGRERTQKEVADIIGISQSYISRLEKKIIRQLREEMQRVY